MKRKKVKKSLSSFSKALDLIIREVGGLSAFSRKLAREGIVASTARINNWRVRGGVPLSEIRGVAQALAVDPWLIGYLDCKKIIEPIPKWPSVVAKGPFTAAEKKEILKNYKVPNESRK